MSNSEPILRPLFRIAGLCRLFVIVCAGGTAILAGAFAAAPEDEPAAPPSKAAPEDLSRPREAGEKQPGNFDLLPGCDVMPVDLPTALRLVNTSNPTIALAIERAREAYYRLRQAQVAWLPDLQTGPSYLRHDGEIQNSSGIVFGTSKSNLFVGGGAFLSWNVSNIYFDPLVAQRLAAAQDAAAQSVTADVQLEAALTYLDLVRVYSALAINADTLARAQEMLRAATAGDKAGLTKSPADINRARAEVELRRSERILLNGQVAVVSARLAQLLLLKPTVKLRPADPPVVPIALVPVENNLDKLVAVGLENRPELRERQNLQEAARLRWKQSRVSPFLPRVEVGYTSGLFGGGFNSDMGNFSGRGDGVAQAVWTLRNLGAGDVAEARARRSQLSEADYYLVEMQAQVGAEVAAAANLVQAREAALEPSQEAVRQAAETWRRLELVAFGMTDPRKREFVPLEPLLAEQALDQARLRYLDDVIEYNKSQFRLYWAMGQPPICALPHASEVPVDVPVVPKEYQPKPPIDLKPPVPMKDPQMKEQKWHRPLPRLPGLNG